MTGNPEINIRLLTSDHILDNFDCGEKDLNQWLQTRAMKNQKLHATRVFVAANNDNQVIGYYGLSMSEIIRVDAPKPTQRNMPNNIPVVMLGRLAIDKNHQNKGLGRYMIKHLIKISVEASKAVATRMIVTQPINDNAYKFYMSVGFQTLDKRPDILAIDLKVVSDFLL